MDRNTKAGGARWFNSERSIRVKIRAEQARATRTAAISRRSIHRSDNESVLETISFAEAKCRRPPFSELIRSDPWARGKSWRSTAECVSNFRVLTYVRRIWVRDFQYGCAALSPHRESDLEIRGRVSLHSVRNSTELYPRCCRDEVKRPFRFDDRVPSECAGTTDRRLPTAGFVRIDS